MFLDGAFCLKRKSCLVETVYRMVCVTLLIVFVVCMGSLTGLYMMNFSDVFFFMHVIHPIVFLILYLGICDENKHSKKSALSTPIFFMIYLLFDYISGQFRGHFVYGFFEVETVSIPIMLLLAAVAYFSSYALGLGVFYLNRKINKPWQQ